MKKMKKPTAPIRVSAALTVLEEALTGGATGKLPEAVRIGAAQQAVKHLVIPAMAKNSKTTTE